MTALLSFVLPFTVYFLTMCPTISSGDSAELITNAFQFGLIHPPGYPLYTFIAKVFTYIPLGSIAWRINLLSVVFMSLSVSFLFFTVNLVIKRTSISLLLALLYGFSPLIWRYAVVTEVFALNQFFLSLFLYFALSLFYTKLPRYFVMMALVAGLALAHHQTFIFVALPLFIWAGLFLYKKINSASLCMACVLFLVGISPYGLLFVFGNSMTLLSWGQIQDFADLLHHILRLDYGMLNLGPRYAGNYFLKNNAQFFVTLWSNSLFILLPILLVSAWSGLKDFTLKTWRSPFVWISVSVIIYTIVFHTLAEIDSADAIYLSVLQRFWMLPYMLLFILAASGFEFLYQKVFTTNRNRIFVVSLSVLVIVQLTMNYQKSNQSKNWLYHDFAKTLLSPVDKDGILLVYGDLDVFTATYMQICEGLRPDVKIVSQARLSYSWYPKILKNIYPELNFQTLLMPTNDPVSMFILENISRHAVFTGPRTPVLTEDWRKYYYELPVGFTNKLTWKDSIPALADYNLNYGSAWGDSVWLQSAEQLSLDWDTHIVQRFYDSEYRRFDFIMKNYPDIPSADRDDLKFRLRLLKKYYQDDTKLNAWWNALQGG